MSEDCVFCKIVAGELPSAKVYEDDNVVAFMDIAPIVKGHTLVVPKAHHDPVYDTPDELLGAVIGVVKQVAKALANELGADGINVTQANGALAGQVVPHVHFHVIPRFNDDPHSWIEPQGEYDRPEEMQEYAEKIRKAVERGA